MVVICKIIFRCFTFKAYVKGYETERIGTTFVDVDKARDFETANNNKTRFNVKNFF